MAVASSRIPVTPATHEELREFRNGLNASFDEAISLMLHFLKQGEDSYSAGKRLRAQLTKVRRGEQDEHSNP